MTRTNVYRDGRLHVREAKCATCIFRPGNLMRLDEGRKDEMLAAAVAAEGVIPCHQTTHRRPKAEAVCRGYWDVAKPDLGLLQVAERLGVVTWVGDNDL